MLFFGISAGVPYLLITSTFYQWLLEEGLSQSVITSFAMYTLPLSIKFLWSHWIDHLKIPILHRLGQYKSWLIFSQLGVLGSLVLLSQVVGNESLYITAGIVFLVSFFTATQDITLGAYRVIMLTKDQQAFGSSQIVIGYRIGILLSGGAALYASSIWGWPIVYILLALVQIQGIITVLLNPEPPSQKTSQKRIRSYQLNRVIYVLYKEFFAKTKWALFLTYIFLFKFGDATLNTFTWIFLRNVGFTKEEISVSVSLGFFANALGAAIAGTVIDKLRIKNSLLITAGLQMLVFLTLWIQAAYPKDHTLMTITIVLENFVCGFAATCVYTLFAFKVSQRFVAIQYTFFASFASFSKVIIATLGGFLLSHYQWPEFFALMFVAPLLSVVVIYQLHNHPKKIG
ncbi:MAG: MFS transporter [Alphaproteobacteria bacterium]|nr:MFS transporter [Alphaproteobacteria bacterium]